MKNIYLNKRIISIVIDIISIFLVALPIIFFIFLIGLSNNLLIRTLILSILFSCFFSKDLLSGQSIGKKRCGLKIVNLDNGEISIFKLILRNLFCVIWPIEIIAILVNPERRLADFILKTKIISYNWKRRESLNATFFISLSTIFCILSVLFYTLFLFLSKSNSIIKLLYS